MYAMKPDMYPIHPSDTFAIFSHTPSLPIVHWCGAIHWSMGPPVTTSLKDNDYSSLSSYLLPGSPNKDEVGR